MTKWVPEPTTMDRKHWCGPYALAVISLQRYDNAYSRILRHINRDRRSWARSRGRNPDEWTKPWIKGLGTGYFQSAARMFKVPFKWQRRGYRRKTLSQLRDHLPYNGVFVVTLTGHFVVVDTFDWTIIDNQSRSWLPFDESPHRRVRVSAVGQLSSAAAKRFREHATGGQA